MQNKLRDEQMVVKTEKLTARKRKKIQEKH